MVMPWTCTTKHTENRNVSRIYHQTSLEGRIKSESIRKEHTSTVGLLSKLLYYYYNKIPLNLSCFTVETKLSGAAGNVACEKQMRREDDDDDDGHTHRPNFSTTFNPYNITFPSTLNKVSGKFSNNKLSSLKSLSSRSYLPQPTELLALKGLK